AAGAVFASYLIRIRVKKEISPDYIHAFFQSDDDWAQIKSSARGGAQQNVNATLLRNLRLPLPSLSEQQRIAAVLRGQLEGVGKARAAAEAQLKAAESLPAAYLREAFRGIVPLTTDPRQNGAPPG